MLQWMGGSRRKVTTSRKSTHNRQKQYFEQRKRQKQTPGQAAQENNTDVRNKQTHYHEEPRSLDILSLINLVSVSQQHHSSQENGSEPGTISPNKLSLPSGPQNVPAAHRSGGQLDGRKLLGFRIESASNNTDIVLNQKEEVQNDVSVLDLLGKDEPKSNSEGRSVPEAHVAFSVEGLGKVGIETPPHSPRVHGRNFPSTPKAIKRIQPVHRKSIPYDLRQKPVHTLMNAFMHGIKLSQDGSPSESMCNLSGILNDFNTKKKKFMSPDAYENLTENCNDEEEIFRAYRDDHKEPRWNTRFSVLDENFLDETEYDTSKNNSFHLEGYPSFPSKAKKIESYDDRFEDPFSESSRSVFEECQRYEVSAPSSPYFKDSKPEKDHNCESFDWERPRAGNESSGFDSIFDPPAWSFLAAEDSQDSMSLLSEESCSSTAVGFGPHSMKLKASKINHRNKHHIGPEKKYVVDKFSPGETMYANLDEAPREKSLAGTGNYEGMPDQWNAGYCSKSSSALKGILESECSSLYEGGHTPAKAAAGPSSYRRTSIEIDAGLFGCEFMPDDNLFDMFPVPQVYAATDFKNRKSKSKIPDGHDSPMKFIYENEPSDPGVQSEKPVTQFPYLSRQQKSGKNNEYGYGTICKPQNKDMTEKKSSSSMNGGSTVIADCKSNCSEHEESRHENQEIFDSPPYKPGETPTATVEVPTQPASCFDEKIDHSNGGSPFPSQIKNQDPMKEKLEPGRNCGAKGGGNPDASYQVMLESYVLQLLCVQKVLMDASEKDIKKV